MTAGRTVGTTVGVMLACALVAIFHWPLGIGFHRLFCPTDVIDFDMADRDGDGKVSYGEARYVCDFVVAPDPLFAGCDSYSAVADGAQLMTVCRGQPVDPVELDRQRRASTEMARRHETARRLLDAAIPNLRLERIYYLSGQGGTQIPTFNGYPIASEAVPSPGMGKSIRSDLRRIVRQSPDSAAACFFPHHGLRFADIASGERYDVLVCFDCGNYRVIAPGEAGSFGDAFRGVDEGAWDALFRASGIARE